MANRRALGRGLEEVILDILGTQRRLPVERISPNPRQPRSAIREEDLETLTESIRRHGVLQPLLVTPLEGSPGQYRLVAGERRWRAAQLAGVAEVPVNMVAASERDLLELALVENLQRSDLGALERAEAFRGLMEDFGLTQVDVAEAMGISRSGVANTLRLLELDPESRSALAEGKITEGHARAVLSISEGPERDRLLRSLLDEGLSVREAERRVQEGRSTTTTESGTPGEGRGARQEPPDADLRDLLDRLQRSLGTRVEVRGKKRGRIVLYYEDIEDREQLIARLLGTSE